MVKLRHICTQHIADAMLAKGGIDEELHRGLVLISRAALAMLCHIVG